MAISSNRRNSRVTKEGSSALGIQRKINSDYEALARDYQKLLIEVWHMPMAKYVLSGLALAAIYPFASRYFSENPELRNRLGKFIPGFEDELSH